MSIKPCYGPRDLLYDRLSGKDRESDEAGVSYGSIERSLKAMQPLLQPLKTLLDTLGVLTMPTLAPPL